MNDSIPHGMYQRYNEHMRILYGIESYLPNVSGVVIFTQRLAAYFAGRGDAVRIVTTSPTGLAYEGKDPAGFYVTRLRGWPNPFRKDLRISVPWERKAIRALLAEFKPDVIHAQGPDPINRLILKEAKRAGIPVIAHHHFSLEFVLGYFRSAKFLHPVIRPLVRYSSRTFYNRCDRVLTPTEFSRRTLLGWGVRVPIEAISNGVELKRFNPADTKSEAKALRDLHKRFSLPSDAPIILYIGRMDKDKNIPTLVEAIPKILEGMPATFLFVGEGTDRKEIERNIAKQPWKERVKFVGFVPHDDPDLVRLYQASRIVWTASTIETQSITTLEAIACGLPVVAANAGALPELVHEGQNGFLVEPYDAAGFADAVLQILSDPRRAEEFSKESVKIASGHAIGKSLERIAAVYREVIGRAK